jgi:hypothetical protein
VAIRTPQITRRIGVVGTIALVAILGLSTGVLGTQAASNEDGIDISVEVVEPSTATVPVAVVTLPIGSSAANATVVITLTGLKPLSFVEIIVNSTPVLLASGLADAAGTFTRTVTLPTGLEAGNHTISATGTMPDGSSFTSTLSSFSVTIGGLLAEPVTVTAVSTTAQASTGGTLSPLAVSQVLAETPAAAAAALGEDPFDLGGVFYLSGLTGSVVPVLGPEGGDITLAFTVKNVTSWPVSADLRFWLENAIGVQTAQSDEIHVDELGPGATKTIRATLADAGQWGAFNAHVTFTPPETVRGTVLSPATRDTLVMMPPYFLLIMLGIAVVLFLAARYLFVWRRARNGSTVDAPVGTIEAAA